MNQPASKEPTMDEILSSIRQIIADDDEAATTKPVRRSLEEVKPVAPAEARKSEQVIDPFEDDEDEAEPLALSNDQIVDEPDAAPARAMADDPSSPAFAGPSEKRETVSPSAEARKPAPAAGLHNDAQAGPMARAVADKARAEAPAGGRSPEDSHAPEAGKAPPASPEAGEPTLVVPDDVAFEQDEDVAGRAEPSRPSIADAAPMPDSELSSELADELLGPATEAVVRSALSKVQAPRGRPDMALGASNLTIEAMIREMLRPMLKEWLEENLPSMVERIVVQEIERVSRGGR